MPPTAVFFVGGKAREERDFEVVIDSLTLVAGDRYVTAPSRRAGNFNALVSHFTGDGQSRP